MTAAAPLAPGEAAAFMPLTFPSYRARLAEPEAGDVAIALRLDGAPVGLALGARSGSAAEALSLFVAPDARGQGLAGALLARLEQELASAGARRIEATYTAGKPTTPALERVLSRAGWSPPAARMLRVKARNETMWGAGWVGLGALAAGDAIVPWRDVSSSERRALAEEQARTGWIPADLSPFEHEAGHLAEASVALRREGAIAGWVITHRLDERTLRYTCSYMHPALQRRGRLLPLYEAVMRRAGALGLERGIWTVPLHHAGMAAFVRRWMAPFADELSETRGSWKPLGPNGA